MHTNFFVLFLYILFIYIAGFIFLIWQFNSIFKKNNFFINLGIAWALGSFIIIVFLYCLAFANKLHYITYKNFTILFTILILIFASILLKLRQKIFSAGAIKNLLVLLIIIIFFLSLIKDSLFSYMIAWDAVAIWFLKAKVFFYSDGVWGNLFFYPAGAGIFQYAHKAYPIGFPLLISAYYRLIQMVNDQTVQFFILFFYLNLVFIFYGFIRKIFKNIFVITSLLLALSFFIMPNFIIYSHNGYADTALSFVFALCTMLFILFFNEKKNQIKFNYWQLILVISGLGMTIKNEGLAFFVNINFLTASCFLYFLYKEKKLIIIGKTKKIISFIILLFIAVAPFLLWLYFKKEYQIEADSYLQQAKIYLNIPSRLIIVINNYLDEFINTSKYNILLIPALFIFVLEYSLFFINKKFKVILPSVILLLQLTAYTLVYLITNIPLEWQVRTTFERLWLHLLPSFLIIVLYQIRPAAELLKKTYLKN